MHRIEGSSNMRILIVDDNVEIHKDFIKILTRDRFAKGNLDDLEKQIFGENSDSQVIIPQFRIDTASQGLEAVERVRSALEEGSPYALAFVDIRMPPGLNGIETIKLLWQLDPDIQMVICTAYSDYSWEETVSELGQSENLLVLKKPFDNVAVRQLACALTKKWQLVQETRHYTARLQKEVSHQTASLQKSLSLVRATLESSSDGILVTDTHGKVVDYNQKLVTMWGVPLSILEKNDGVQLLDYMKSKMEDPQVVFSGNQKTLENSSDFIKRDVIKLKDGKIFECHIQLQKINEETVGNVFDFRDITKRIKLENDLQYQATHDALTGLPNRVLLLDRIKQKIKKFDKTHEEFSVLFIDLNRFKIINDSLSHAVGDEVLKITGNRLRAILRADDTLARLGGDEFVIVLSKVASREVMLRKVRRILDVFNEPFSIDGRNLVVGASIGISMYPTDGATADMLLRNADAAMYLAKEQRGVGFQFYTDDLNVKSIERLDQEIQLRHAIANNEFFLCYQPQIDLTQKKIVAAEALLRWQHPQKGVILPLDFISLAEETGLILPVGEWVMRQACIQNKKWQDQGLPPIRVAVNVTAQQFSHQDIVGLVTSILQETRLAPQYLELELTENVIVSNPEIIHAVTELNKLGVTFAIDDFGTGYTSLSYLKKIPLDRLKIDKSFIQHIESCKDDEVIVRAVIAMAKNLNLEVLAEGVETQGQLRFLKQHDCMDVQGFYFSKPLTVGELETYLGRSGTTVALPEKSPS